LGVKVAKEGVGGKDVMHSELPVPEEKDQSWKIFTSEPEGLERENQGSEGIEPKGKKKAIGKNLAGGV